jgi:AcrR family transcriptional regulator
VLLDQAEAVLRERGIDALSLRELAREAGVSHGAPRSHFIDRSALLDALAERGFIRLADEMREAASHAPEDHARALHAAGSAYVRFAVREPALLDLMFAAKVDDPAEAVRSAAERLFDTMTSIMSAGVEAGAYDAADVGRLALVLAATVQGISALVTSRRITAPQSEALIDDAITLFLAGASTDR